MQIWTEHLCVHYHGLPALRDVNLEVYRHQVTAIIGPQGAGKSTFLRCLNRTNDLIAEAQVSGDVYLDGTNIYAKSTNVASLRAKIGMVQEVTAPFPKSIFENVAFGLRLAGIHDPDQLHPLVQSALEQTGLWPDVENLLDQPASKLSPGKRRQLCLARAVAPRPLALLLDEAISLLDPYETARLEDLIYELRNRYTILFVTQSWQQAARVSDFTAFFCDGELIETGRTTDLFTRPRQRKTEEFLTGRMG